MTRTRFAALLWLCVCCCGMQHIHAEQQRADDTDKIFHPSTFFDASHAPPADYMSHDNQNKRLLFQQRVQSDKQEAMTRRFLSSQAHASHVFSTFEDSTATTPEIIELDYETSRQQNQNPRRGRRRVRSSSPVRGRKTLEEETTVDRQTILENPLQNFENRRDATGRTNRNYKHPQYQKVDHQHQQNEEKDASPPPPKKEEDDSDGSADYGDVSVPYPDDDDGSSNGYGNIELPWYEDDDNPYGDVSVPYYADDDNSDVGYGDISVPNYGHGYDVGYGDVSVPKGKGQQAPGDDDDGSSNGKGVGAKRGGDDDDGGGKGKGGKGKSGKKGKGDGIYYPDPKGPDYPSETPHCPCAGRPQCHCDGGHIPDGFEYEFAMVREEVGTPDPAEQFRIASTLGINGYLHDVVHSMGQTTYTEAPIGLFNGVCTVTGYPSDLLCTYEIVVYTNTQKIKVGGPNGFGAVVAHGPVSGRNNMAIVTGTEFDFDMYHRGSLALKQDPTSPVLYATLKLHG